MTLVADGLVGGEILAIPNALGGPVHVRIGPEGMF